MLLATLPGCEAVNGFYFGLEEDVDAFVGGLDAAGERFLPHGPRPPREARRADRTRVRFEPQPDAEGSTRPAAGERDLRPGPGSRGLARGVSRAPGAAPAAATAGGTPTAAEEDVRTPPAQRVRPPAGRPSAPPAAPAEVAWPPRPDHDPPRHFQLVNDPPPAAWRHAAAP
ncbi:hypothetical protein PSMK_05300 [Phycisphaera mikurensis NBRC 102666]|uniref:Uncharacterized protein n=1 Tax=Phycisphaera mikurensis (strain NBRC 102666 / KCTC 22515 / FYK2301M01) TaxID=1142394 RepID=I0IBQ1_PHYMF|nr:hypothetical protein PSMK_05300 [Phycisphaera mikurensis NBRC 102666]